MKLAYVKVAAEVLPEASAVIRDHGLEIVGSRDNDQSREHGIVVLDLQGDKLPDECFSHYSRQVTITIQSEVYGRQRINRISEIRVVD